MWVHAPYPSPHPLTHRRIHHGWSTIGVPAPSARRGGHRRPRTVILTPGTATAAGTGAITGYGGKCVDVSGANSANGTKVQRWTCNGTNAQTWTVGTDGTIRALGKCLDVSGGSTADGAKVQIWDCNGTGAQQWVANAAKDIVNPQSGKCLDATGVSSADGTPLQIWSCSGGANQKWTVPGGTSVMAVMAAPYYYNGWANPTAASRSVIM